MASRGRGLKRPTLPAEVAERVPPGQFLTERWPVLHYGDVPTFDPATWDLRVIGLVARPLRFTWDEFRTLPLVERRGDLHCVSRWSKLDNRWQGVSLNVVLERAGVLPGARFVLFRCEAGYTTSIPLEVARSDDVLLAVAHDGAPLSPAHGFPVRAVIPGRYAWKSAKWVRAIELLEEDQLGFWERHGYSNRADPWDEERFNE